MNDVIENDSILYRFIDGTVVYCQNDILSFTSVTVLSHFSHRNVTIAFPGQYLIDVSAIICY